MITEICIADTETTGIDPAKDSLLEVAQVFMPVDKPDNLIGDWTYIEYNGVIPPEAKAVHHIVEKDVEHGAERCVPRDVHIKAMLDLHHDGYAYAFHNAPFDLGFLPELKDVPVICTYQCALHLYPDAPSYKNQVLRYWLGVEPKASMLEGLSPHRALYDSAVTAALLEQMLMLCSPEDLVELTKRPVLLKTVNFGKYKGESWKNVPSDYRGWMRRSGNWSDDANVMYTLDVLDGRREHVPLIQR